MAMTSLEILKAIRNGTEPLPVPDELKSTMDPLHKYELLKESSGQRASAQEVFNYKIPVRPPSWLLPGSIDETQMIRNHGSGPAKKAAKNQVLGYVQSITEMTQESVLPGTGMVRDIGRNLWRMASEAFDDPVGSSGPLIGEVAAMPETRQFEVGPLEYAAIKTSVIQEPMDWVSDLMGVEITRDESNVVANKLAEFAVEGVEWFALERFLLGKANALFTPGGKEALKRLAGKNPTVRKLLEQTGEFGKRVLTGSGAYFGITSMKNEEADWIGTGLAGIFAGAVPLAQVGRTIDQAYLKVGEGLWDGIEKVWMKGWSVDEWLPRGMRLLGKESPALKNFVKMFDEEGWTGQALKGLGSESDYLMQAAEKVERSKLTPKAEWWKTHLMKLPEKFRPEWRRLRAAKGPSERQQRGFLNEMFKTLPRPNQRAVFTDIITADQPLKSLARAKQLGVIDEADSEVIKSTHELWKDMISHGKIKPQAVPELTRDTELRFMMNQLDALDWNFRKSPEGLNVKRNLQDKVRKGLADGIDRDDFRRTQIEFRNLLKREEVPAFRERRWTEFRQDMLPGEMVKRSFYEQLTDPIWSRVMENPSWFLDAKEAKKLKRIRKKNQAWFTDPETGVKWVHGPSGPLRKGYVPKEIADSLKEYHRMGDFMRGFGWYMSKWKLSKTAMRPATVQRNVIGNVILNDIMGMPWHRMDLYSKAAKDLLRASKLGSGKVSPELAEFLTEGGLDIGLASGEFYINMAKGFKNPKDFIGKMIKSGSKFGEEAANVYESTERWGKYAKYLHNREKGLGVTDAVEDAIQATFDYGDVSPANRWLRDTGLMPFATFFFKAMPTLTKAAATHPLRAGKWPLGFEVMRQQAFKSLDMSDKEITDLKESMPDWMRSGALLPWPTRDQHGRIQLLDATYMLPWGEYQDFSRRGVLGTFFQNPVINTISDLRTNQDFAGRTIAPEWMDERDRMVKQGMHMAKNLLPIPPLMIGGTDFQKIADAAKYKPGPSSRTALQTGLTVGGPLPIYPRRERDLKRWKQMDVERDTREARQSMKRELKRARTPTQKMDIRQRHKKAIRRLKRGED